MLEIKTIREHVENINERERRQYLEKLTSETKSVYLLGSRFPQDKIWHKTD